MRSAENVKLWKSSVKNWPEAFFFFGLAVYCLWLGASDGFDLTNLFFLSLSVAYLFVFVIYLDRRNKLEKMVDVDLRSRGYIQEMSGAIAVLDDNKVFKGIVFNDNFYPVKGVTGDYSVGRSAVGEDVNCYHFVFTKFPTKFGVVAHNKNYTIYENGK